MVISVFSLIALSLFSSLSAAKITIQPDSLPQLAAKSDRPSFTASLEDSFALRVTVSEAEGKPTEISIAGLDNFDRLSESSSSSIQFVNGKRSSSYVYTLELSPNIEGIFALGPAFAKENGKVVESEPIQIHVTKGATKPIRPGSSEQNGPRVCFAQVELSNNNPFVWEATILTLRIWAQEGKVYDVNMEDPSFDGFEVKKLSSGQRRTSVERTPYIVVETEYLLTPNKPGSSQIGPMTVNYRAQVDSSSDHDPFFDDLFHGFFGRSMRGREGRVRSNTLTMDVQSIPSKARHVHGIGSFSGMTVTTDKAESAVHEPIKVKLSLSGTGNFDQVDAPKLQLPPKWKVYNSSSRFAKSRGAATPHTGTKEFDYIVQVPKSGKTTFPKQIFKYFDTEEKAVKTIHSKPIDLVINSKDGDPLDLFWEDDEKAKAEEANITATAQTADLTATKTEVDSLEGWTGTSTATSDSGMGWAWFLLLALLPLMGAFGWRAHQWWKTRGQDNSPLKKGLKELAELEKEDKHNELYHLLIRFCANILRGRIKSVDESWVQKKLLKIEMPPGKVDSFMEFLNSCASHSFGHGGDTREQVVSLFRQAESWMRIINGYINPNR